MIGPERPGGIESRELPLLLLSILYRIRRMHANTPTHHTPRRMKLLRININSNINITIADFPDNEDKRQEVRLRKNPDVTFPKPVYHLDC